MYLITAIINSECLTNLLEDLKSSEIEGVTISHVKGKGGWFNKADKAVNNMDEYIRLDIVVSNDKYKELAKEAIRVNARELIKGSGKMWVTPVLEVERIRTGEINEDALSHVKIEHTSKLVNDYFTALDTPSS